MPYQIEYSEKAKEHLKPFTARNRKIVMDAVDKQLQHQPILETKKRKKLHANPVAPWELRIGDFRVYFDVGEIPDQKVNVLAVGIKKSNRVFIDKEEIKL